MEYWKPNYANQSTNYPSSGLMAANSLPLELPSVGDSFLLMITNYGTSIVSDGASIPLGAEVVEVEVTAVKKAKVTLE